MWSEELLDTSICINSRGNLQNNVLQTDAIIMATCIIHVL